MTTNSKSFIITITSDEQTRFVQDDAFLALQLKFIAVSVVQSITLGSVPFVECEKSRADHKLRHGGGES